MVSALLIFGIIMLYSWQTLFCKLYSDNYDGKSELSTPVFCILEAFAIVIISLAFNGFKFNVSWQTLLIGVINAFVLFTYNTSIIAAGERGSYAFLNLTMLFGGIIIPLIYEIVWMGNIIAWYKYIAIAAMLVAFVLMNLDGLKPGKVRKSYYVFCLLLLLSNGLYGTLIKIQDNVNTAQGKEMIIITYALMGIIALVQLAVKEKKNTLSAFKMNRRALIFLILCIVTAGIAINGLVAAMSLIDVSVLFTIENGGVLLLATIYAMVLFKEKASAPKLLGMAIALVSITVLSL